jgi:hypothetical protein
VYSIQHDKVCQWVEAGLWIFPVTPVSSTNKTEILLKVALNIIALRIFQLYHGSQLISEKNAVPGTKE